MGRTEAEALHIRAGAGGHAYTCGGFGMRSREVLGVTEVFNS